MDCGPDVPLVMLLAKATGEFTREFDRRLADSGFGSISLAHSKNVLRFLSRDEPRRAAAIVGQGGVSKQAVSQQIAHLAATGYLRVTADPDDQRARRLALTAKGEKVQQRVVELFAEIEADWAERLGAANVATVRRTLRALIEDTAHASPERHHAIR